MFDKTTKIDLHLDNKTLQDFLGVVKGLLIVYLSGKETDIKKVRMEIVNSILQRDWDKEHAQEAELINKALKSKGESIRKNRELYREDLLLAEKQHKPTELIKAKLEVLDKLMEGIDNV